MASGDWNFLAGRLVGDGSIDILETELPIQITSIDRNLSAPSGMDGTITNRVKRLTVNGQPIFQPWNTVIIAEASGFIRGMTIYQKPTFQGAAWNLEQIGFGGYPLDMPYDGETSFMQADPLDMFRHAWDHLQGKPYGNLGVTLDPTTSPIRVGTPAVEGDSASGPRKWNWWDTKNLAGELDDLAGETPFDWLEQFSWTPDGQPHCHLALGYPQLGGRTDRLRLVLGENLATAPSLTEGEFASEVWAYGAGEGRAMVRGRASVVDGRIRRVKVVEDSGLTVQERASARARGVLNRTRGNLQVDTLEVYDHPNAPLQSLEPGMEIPLFAETDHVTFDDYVRIIGRSESPQTSDRATLTVTRVVQA